MSDQKVEDDATGGGYVLEENSPNDFLGPETDFSALSTHVQDIARRLNQEFEIIMESHGPAVVESLLPTIVNVLEKLDELYKDETAYKAEVLQLREDNASLLSELERERCARRESENRLMIMEDQFEDERKILNEALMHNETQIRQLEMKSKNTEEQRKFSRCVLLAPYFLTFLPLREDSTVTSCVMVLDPEVALKLPTSVLVARLELKELESSKENSKLHERINELLRSHAELNDSLKNSAVVPVSTPLRQCESDVLDVRYNADQHVCQVFILKALMYPSNRQLGNAFDTTSAGLGFDELSAMEADFSPPPEDDLPGKVTPPSPFPPPPANPDRCVALMTTLLFYPLAIKIGMLCYSLPVGCFSGCLGFYRALCLTAGMQKEVNILIRENMDLVETKNALNVVKDDLLNQRDVLKSENQLLAEAVQQLSEKQTKLQQELANSDQLLTAARTELEALKASVTKLKAEASFLSPLHSMLLCGVRGDKSSSSKRFTKAEMARLICDRNYYKERFLELQDAIKLTETLRASQRGHPELLKDLPSTVTDVQLHPHQQQQHHGEGVLRALPPRSRLNLITFARVNLISLPRLDFGFDAVNLYDLQTDPDQPHLRHTEEAEVASGDKAVVANTAGPAVPFNSQKWIKLYQAGAAAPVFGWVRGFGRVKPESNSLAAAPKNPTLLFSPRAYPVPKKCRSIGGPSLRIELTAAISVPSPVEDSCTQHLWLIGRGSSMLSGSTKTSKNVGKIYIFDPLQLTEVLVGQDLPDDFLPISAAVFSVGGEELPLLCPVYLFWRASNLRLRGFVDHSCLLVIWTGHGSSSPVAKSGRFIVRDFRTLQTDKRSEPVNTFRVLVASSDGRFLVCASTRNPDAVSQSDVCKLVLLATLRLANPGESATSVVCLDYRVCLGVLNSSGLNQLVTLKWLLDSSGTPKNDIELNQFLRVSAMSLPGGAPSGPMILSTIYDRAFFWLGTVGGGAVHCFDLNKSAFVTELALPSQTPCLHAVAVGHRASPDADSRLIWLAVSGLSSQASTQQRTSDSSSETVSIGPLSRLLSICSKKHLFLHNIDLTSVLTSMIDMTDVVDPVDLTVSRLLVQGDECIWFSTRCGLIGRFFNASLPADAAHGSPTEVLNQDAISLSCHAYRRPVSALITIRNRVEAPSADSQDTKATASPSSNQASFLVVAVGHDYTYLRTSTPATRAPPATSAIVSAVNQCVRRSFTGAHAIVWSVAVTLAMSESVTLPDGRPVDSLKVAELKKELDALGLDKSGLKKDLAQRLTETSPSPKKKPVEITETAPDAVSPKHSVDLGEIPSSETVVSEAAENQVGFAFSPETSPTTEPQPVQGGHSPSCVDVNNLVPTTEDTQASPPASASRAKPSQKSSARKALPLATAEASDEFHEEEEDYGEVEDDEASSNTATSQPKADTPASAAVNGDASRPSPPPPPPAKKETRGVGFIVEGPERVSAAAAAKCPPSQMVYIRCLVRPFTAGQLSAMLEAHFGKPEELWLDKIKSSAIVRLADETVAARCREGLDGCRWPSINPKILHCEFASQELFTWLKQHGESGDRPPPKYLLGGTADDTGQAGDRKRPLASGNSKSAGQLENERKRRRVADGDPTTEHRGKEEDNSKSLDDLFKKTDTAPSIYWLPLTDEGAAAQLKARTESYLSENARRPVPRRNVDERRRETRSPFTGELSNGSSGLLARKPTTDDAIGRDRRAKERSPSIGSKRARDRRRSPPPRSPPSLSRRPRYASRTPSPRFAAPLASRRPPSPPPRGRRRSAPRLSHSPRRR
ncbi:unnamed protein product [Mesocestoides corti]|uniref:SAP domain-containing protein n=1 Tax=Mesocestoides corti TaxID=53468 RepID=A0A158QTC5_MESCO|nr:unnamed protein product [Mesocestoides corti]